MRVRCSILLLFAAVVSGLQGCADENAVGPGAVCHDPSSDSWVADRLADGYRQRNLEAFASLLHTDYQFVYFTPDPVSGATSHGRIDELRLHRRFFEPENVVPGDPAWPPELWLASVAVTLSPRTEFTERTDLYRSPENPQGLDPERWRAYEATYASYFFFETQGETDFQVDGLENFVVVRDLAAPVCSQQLFFYRWEDLSGGSTWFRGALYPNELPR